MNREDAIAFIASIYRVISESKDKSNAALYATSIKYYEKRAELEELFPEIFELMPGVSRPVLVNSKYSKYTESEQVEMIEIEAKAFLDFYSTINAKNTSISPRPRKVFISHGQKEDWRKVQEYIEKVQEIPTMELAQQANRGRTIFQKLIDESDQCSFAVIVMTGDDLAADEQVRARENVIHEIGYFQGKYGPDRVCLLHEAGVNIPSNIHGLVYIPFPKDGIEAAFGGLTRELKHL